jgi:hypothetical protein
MNEKSIKIVASAGLIIGGLLGLAGSFVPSAQVRGLAWGIDGASLVMASALLTIYYFRKGSDMVAGGFLIFGIGEGIILSGSGLSPETSTASFGAGTILWAVALAVISMQNTFPVLIRCTGFIAAGLFFVVSVMIFTGSTVNALTKPLPFFAYPFFVVTIFGWAWALLRKDKLL